MNDENIDFSKFTNPESEGYKKRLSRAQLFSVINSYVICPITLLALLLGVLFNIEDGIKSFSANIKNPSELYTPIDTDKQAEEVTEEAEPSVPDVLDGVYITDRDGNISASLSDYYLSVGQNVSAIESAIESTKYGYKPIVSLDLSRYSSSGEIHVNNNSKYELDFSKYKEEEIECMYKDDEDYLALVIHTHGSESFLPEDVSFEDENEPYKSNSTDEDENMIAVGERFCSELEKSGIKALHCKLYFDDEAYTESYRRAGKEIEAILKKHPTIKYVFDLQRDSITLSGGQRVRTVCEATGNPAAQVMLVVGTDSLGENCENWEDNLTFAVKLQERLESRYKNFTRPAVIKQSAYNQQYSKISLTVFIGSDGNTVGEARLSAKLTAREIAQMIKGE